MAAHAITPGRLRSWLKRRFWYTAEPVDAEHPADADSPEQTARWPRRSSAGRQTRTPPQADPGRRSGAAAIGGSAVASLGGHCAQPLGQQPVTVGGYVLVAERGLGSRMAEPPH
jgi:hypothetical protein